MDDITKQVMEDLYSIEKVLVEDIFWDRTSANLRRYSFTAAVLTVEGEELLSVCGKYWGKGYSFVLRYQNNPIRLWDFNDHHEGINGGHKHKFTAGEFQKEDPYDVNDVTTSDVNQALIDFLVECNIRYDDVTIHKLTGLDAYE